MLDLEAHRAALFSRLRDSLPIVRRGVASVYDVTSRCNLTCDGCFYFSRDADLISKDAKDISAWAGLLAYEGERGVNMAIVAGAEPSLRPDIVEMIAGYIPTGAIFTNGTKVIPQHIDYRIVISLWGNLDTSARLRGANVVDKAFRNYAGDHRAIFLYTINSANIDEIRPVVELCHREGMTLTFQYYSPTHTYLDHILGKTQTADPRYHHSTRATSLQLTQDDQTRVNLILDKVMQDYPETVLYSKAYNTWMGNPEKSPFDIDSKGLAINCEQRVSHGFRHHNSDATHSLAKCGHASIDCSTCRAIPGGLSSYLRHKRVNAQGSAATDIQEMEDWLEVYDVWHAFFIHHQRPAFDAALARTRTTRKAARLAASS